MPKFMLALILLQLSALAQASDRARVLLPNTELMQVEGCNRDEVVLGRGSIVEILPDVSRLDDIARALGTREASIPGADRVKVVRNTQGAPRGGENCIGYIRSGDLRPINDEARNPVPARRTGTAVSPTRRSIQEDNKVRGM